MRIANLQVPSAVFLAACAVSASKADERGVQALRIDGTSLTGQWLGSDGQDAVQIRSESGQARLALEELSSIRFGTAAAVPPSGGDLVHLADGGRLFGELIGGEADTVVFRTQTAEWRLPFRAIAGIRTVQGEEHAKSAELFDAALDERLPGQDVLITRGPDEVKSLRGRLERLDAEGGAFVFADKSRTFQIEKLYGIVFASGVATSAAYAMTVELADGSSFSGDLEHADAESLRIRTSFGATAQLKLHEVIKVVLRSDRVTYLSDLKPVSQRVEGLVHTAWPVRIDRSVSVKPLSIAGRLFDKGLGVHSLTELRYKLSGGYEAFVTTIGIDDAVRPRGSVVFRVLGDGRELFNSGEVTGGDPPRDVRLDVSGVTELTLLVEYGAGLDLSDHADWGGARVLRPAAARPKDDEQ